MYLHLIIISANPFLFDGRQTQVKHSKERISSIWEVWGKLQFI